MTGDNFDVFRIDFESAAGTGMRVVKIAFAQTLESATEMAQRTMPAQPAMEVVAAVKLPTRMSQGVMTTIECWPQDFGTNPLA